MTAALLPATELGDKLAAWAEELTLERLADAVGVQAETLSGIIRGRHEPTRETVTLIAAWAEVAPWVVERWSRSAPSGLAFPCPRRRGGVARASRLTPERLREIATMGADARRWRPTREQMALPGIMCTQETGI